MNMSDVTTMSAMFFGNSYVGIVCDAQDGRNILFVIVSIVCDSSVRFVYLFAAQSVRSKSNSQVKKQCKIPK